MKTSNQLFKRILITLAVVLSTGLSAGNAMAAQKADKPETPELLNIALLWKPTVTVSAMGAIDLTVFKNKSITIKPFNDLRAHPAEIGKNVEKKLSTKVLLVTTKDNVAAWLTDRFASVLREFEAPVVKEGGTMSLEADIVKFYVTEESVYKADIGLKIRARSKTGDVIWEGMIAVSNQNWGNSYKAENYYEVLSNTFVDAVNALLKSDSFMQAVQKNK
jgi:hypothetical protein